MSSRRALFRSGHVQLTGPPGPRGIRTSGGGRGAHGDGHGHGHGHGTVQSAATLAALTPALVAASSGGRPQPPTPGTPTFVAASSYTPSVATTSFPVPTPTGFRANDLLLTLLLNPVSQSAFFMPAGWNSTANAFTSGSGNNFNALIAYKIADGTEGATVTFTTATSGRPAGGMFAWSGTDLAHPVNAHNAYTQSVNPGTAYQTQTVTPTVNGCLIVAVFFGYQSAPGTYSFTPRAGWTERADIPNTNNGAAVELQELTQQTAAAVFGSATGSASSTLFSGILALKGT